MGVIYRMTFPNGKRYVGLTTQLLSKRMGRHRSNARNGSEYPVHAAIRKYGFDSVVVETIATADTKEELAVLECFHIKSEGCKHPSGYNLDDGGYFPTITDEVRRKISEGRTGIKRSSQECQDISKRTKDQWDRPGFKARMSAQRRAMWANPEYRQMMLAARKK
jgi:group I intron endonuclease